MNADSMPKCPQCGAPLPPDAPDGLCPKCVMALNLKTETLFSADPSPAPHQAPLTPNQIARHFPQLEILEYLGRGGMGVVYKARQKSLNRLVALKLLAPERVHDAEFAARFTREAQALAALNHPNIVTIHDFGRADLPVGLGSEAAQQQRPTEAIYYFVMEFVDGVNLRHLLRSRKFTPEEALTVVPPLCDALQYAHERGIVHRDIKPENILLAKDGRVKVADFGIAKIVGAERGSVSRSSDDASNAIGSSQTHGSGNVAAGHSPAVQDLTEAHQTFGTPGYSAPEQKTDPQRVDSRADIYSLGVVFYEMLTGELPGKRIEPPSKKVHIDVRLDEIVLRALESKPELRYQQASVFKTQVETIAETPAPGSSRREEAHKKNSNQSIDLRVRTEVVVGWVAIIGSLAVILYQLRWIFSNKPPGTDFLERFVISMLVLVAGFSMIWASRRKKASLKREDNAGSENQSLVTSAATDAKPPWQLIVVAIISITCGLPSVWSTGASLAQGTLPTGLNTGLLNVLIGVGLLRFRPWWRKIAIFILLLSMTVIVIAGLLSLSGVKLSVPHGAVICGYWIKNELLGGLVNLAMLILAAWQYLVLIRPDVKALFNKRGFDRPLFEWAVLLVTLAVSGWIALITQPLRDSSSPAIMPMLTASTTVAIELGGVALFGVAMFMISRNSRAASKPPNADALAAIDAWLALMDKRDYAGTWQTATPLFRRVVSETEWTGKCVKIRKPLGNVIVRELKTSKTSFFGKHFKAQFATRFDGGFDAVETVTFSHQPDGSWKALTYIVRIGTQLARDWRLAFWLVFATMLFASLFGTGINLAVKRATEARQLKRGALQSELGNNIATLLGDTRRITYSQLTFEHVPYSPWKAVVHFTGLQSWRDASNQPLPQPHKIKGDIVLDYQPPNEWSASGTGDLYGLGAAWHTATGGFPEWPDTRVMPVVSSAVFNAAHKVSFGPTIECLLVPEDNSRRALNLAFGNVVAPGPGRALDFSPTGTNSIRAAGVDLYVQDGWPTGVLSTLDMRACVGIYPQTTNESDRTFDKISADEAQQMLAESEQWRFTQTAPLHDFLWRPVLNIVGTNLYLFITRNDVQGALQIVSSDSSGVKIRYKLVQPRNIATRLYTIERGDTAARIARRFGMTISELKALNPDLNWNQLRVGREARVYGEEPLGTETNAAARITNSSAQHEFEFRWVAAKNDTNSPADDLTSTRTNDAGDRIVEHYRVLRDVVLSDRDVESAGFSEYQSAEKKLEIFLYPEAREKFAEATAKNIRRQLAIVWRTDVISAPMIQSALPGGRVQISGNFSDADAQELLDLLNHRTAELRPPSFDFAFSRSGSLNGGHNLVEFRMTRKDGPAQKVSLKSQAGIDAQIELQESTGEQDTYGVTFGVGRGILPPIWNFTILYVDRSQQKRQATFTVSNNPPALPTAQVGLSPLNIPQFHFHVSALGSRGASFILTRFGNPETEFKVRAPTGISTYFNYLQTTPDYDQLEINFTADSVLPAVWKFSVEFLDRSLNFHTHFFEVSTHPNEAAENRVTVRELESEKIIRNVQVPELRFVAWQDEWQTNAPFAARHPDGSAVTTAEELKWLKSIMAGGVDVSALHLSPEPRFLKLWFSHPEFDAASIEDTKIFDDEGTLVPTGRGFCGSSEDANFRNGNMGWYVCTLSMDTNLVDSAKVRLRYAVGLLERTQEVNVVAKQSVSMSLEGGSQLNGVGQNVDGRAFVSIAFDGSKLGARRFGVHAMLKDGRELICGADRSGYADGTGVQIAKFVFNAPLSDVSKFIIGTRPVRTMEWKDVVLPK